MSVVSRRVALLFLLCASVFPLVASAQAPAAKASEPTYNPMIKAGRLALELHPWQVPQGALPVTPK